MLLFWEHDGTANTVTGALCREKYVLHIITAQYADIKVINNSEIYILFLMPHIYSIVPHSQRHSYASKNTLLFNTHISLKIVS